MPDTRRDIDVDFLDTSTAWMDNAVVATEPFFIYFNHTNVHFPILPHVEYHGSSNGGAVADCLQMLDADFGTVLAELDELGIADDTIAVVAYAFPFWRDRRARPSGSGTFRGSSTSSVGNRCRWSGATTSRRSGRRDVARRGCRVTCASTRSAPVAQGGSGDAGSRRCGG
jgi:hypothetical protein